MVAIGEPARIIYTNYRGETAERTITPKRVWYGISDWHPVPQWFLTAFDHDKNADRDFALIDFGYPRPSAVREMALGEIRAMAEKQKAYWFDKQKGLKGLEDAYSEDGEEYTPLGDHEAWKSGSANGHYSEADWFLKTIENLLSQPAPNHSDAGKVEGDGWLPIESAPKDGTIVLLGWNDPDIEEIGAVAGWYEGGPADKCWYDQYHEPVTATHWMHLRPLPSAPASEGAE